MRIVIVTGASGGLGAEFVRRIDRLGILEDWGIDEIWGIARSGDKLRKLGETLHTPFRPLALDLTDGASFNLLRAMLRGLMPEVWMVVNAAGVGKIGGPAEIPGKELDRMIDLNCKAPVRMTGVTLPYIPRGGRIVEVCSTAAFQPFPYLNVYAASKAFLCRYSRALGRELRGRGISVTAVCPYWVKDTGFIGKARCGEGGDKIRSFPFASEEKAVVRQAVRDALMRKPVSTPGPVCTIHRAAAKLLPESIMMDLWEWIRRI